MRKRFYLGAHEKKKKKKHTFTTANWDLGIMLGEKNYQTDLLGEIIMEDLSQTTSRGEQRERETACKRGDKGREEERRE